MAFRAVQVQAGAHQVLPKRFTPNQCRPPVSAASHESLRTLRIMAQQRSPVTNDRSSFLLPCQRRSCPDHTPNQGLDLRTSTTYCRKVRSNCSILSTFLIRLLDGNEAAVASSILRATRQCGAPRNRFTGGNLLHSGHKCHSMPLQSTGPRVNTGPCHAVQGPARRH